MPGRLPILRHEGGNIAVITAVLLVPIIGVLALGVEASSWSVMDRAAQNAADSAAVAAANNGKSAAVNSYPQYAWEGWAAARRYGFANNASATRTSGACPSPYQAYTCYQSTADNATVQLASGVTCPDGTATCHLAIVTKKLPIYLARVVGFAGDTTIGAGRAVTAKSVALAEPISAISYTTCLTTTGNDSKGNGLDLKGIPKSDMVGCSISATGPASPVSCNGQGVGEIPPSSLRAQLTLLAPPILRLRIGPWGRIPTHTTIITRKFLAA